MSGFQVKDFVSVVASQINHAKATQDKITDFNVGSVARTLMEAPAIEIDELYQRMLAGVVEAIPTSIYRAFSFDLIGASAARGNVLLTFGIPIEEAFTVPAGTVFEAPDAGVKFVSDSDVQVPVGAVSASVLVYCAVTGVVGNVGSGAISRASGVTLPNSTVVSNDPFVTGRDQQTEEERKRRFTDFINAVSRGTSDSVKYAAWQSKVYSASGLLLEYVTRVGLKEVPGSVDLFIYGSAGLPSAQLIASAQSFIDGYFDEAKQIYVPGYRPCGVRVRVLPMIERSVNVSMSVKMLSGFAMDDGSLALLDGDIANVCVSLFDAIVAGDVLLMQDIADSVLAIAGVERVVINNDANVPCAENEALRLGALTVGWLNA